MDMNPLKSIMGRRQFLIGTGIASTCALTCRKLAGFQARSAKAAGQTALAASTAAGKRCPHLLAPLRIRNRLLKNRIMHTVSPTYFMQGPENYPTEMYRNHYSNMAKNAAIVSVSTHFASDDQQAYQKASEITVDNAFNHYTDRSWADISLTYNYINEMIDDIHYQGSMILFSGNTGQSMGGGGMPGGGEGGPGGMPPGGGMPQGQEGMQGAPPSGGMPGGEGGGGMPPQGGMPGAAGGPSGPGGFGMSAKSDEEILAEARAYEKKGYDVYEFSSTSRELADEIRATTNLILMNRYNAGGGMMGPGTNAASQGGGDQPAAADLERVVAQARELEGIADIMWIRIHEHPSQWNQEEGKPVSLYYAEAIKKAGIDIITCPSAGFHDPVLNDEFIASGRTDMVGMTTPLFADPELVRKIKEGRPDDIIPCVGCGSCHGIHMASPPWYSTCTVNPKWGLPPYQLQGFTTPRVSKKVAVIGGGPSGMKAAVIAAERGHKVTLYEREEALGGLLKISDESKCRYDHKKLKEYLIRQVTKAGVEVRVKTAATPETIKAEGFDTVLVAAGADVVTSRMTANGSKMLNILESYTRKDELGKTVVILGAGQFGVEAAVSMLKDGRKVWMITGERELVSDSGPHTLRNQQEVYQNNPDFTAATGATVRSISGGTVTYADASGKETSVKADSIVIWSGLKPRMDEAQAFAGSADDVLFLGDCTGQGGSIQKTLRSAFFVASSV